MAEENKSGGGCTVSFGGVVAAMISYKINQSLGWAFLHLCLGWLYVAYALIFRHTEVLR
jgi:hypothetical protein